MAVVNSESRLRESMLRSGRKTGETSVAVVSGQLLPCLLLPEPQSFACQCLRPRYFLCSLFYQRVYPSKSLHITCTRQSREMLLKSRRKPDDHGTKRWRCRPPSWRERWPDDICRGYQCQRRTDSAREGGGRVGASPMGTCGRCSRTLSFAGLVHSRCAPYASPLPAAPNLT